MQSQKERKRKIPPLYRRARAPRKPAAMTEETTKPRPAGRAARAAEEALTETVGVEDVVEVEVEAIVMVPVLPDMAEAADIIMVPDMVEEAADIIMVPDMVEAADMVALAGPLLLLLLEQTTPAPEPALAVGHSFSMELISASWAVAQDMMELSNDSSSADKLGGTAEIQPQAKLAELVAVLA